MCIKLKTISTILLLMSLLFCQGALWAKDAVPMASDPELEKKVMDIAHELRCLVCQNQTIADSHAGLAIDLKNQVREMVKSGKTRDEVVNYMVERYGDFVRYYPPVKPSTYLLFGGPFIFLVIGLTLLIMNLKKRKVVIPDQPLSEEDSGRLKSLLGESDVSSSKSKNNEEGAKS